MKSICNIQLSDEDFLMLEETHQDGSYLPIGIQMHVLEDIYSRIERLREYYRFSTVRSSKLPEGKSSHTTSF